MKVLLDEYVPRKLRRQIASHEVRTVHRESGWSDLKNGALALAEFEFDVFLTVDRNLIFQQNVQWFRIGIILMVARNNRFRTLLPLMPEVNAAIEKVKTGELAR